MAGGLAIFQKKWTDDRRVSQQKSQGADATRTQPPGSQGEAPIAVGVQIETLPLPGRMNHGICRAEMICWRSELFRSSPLILSYLSDWFGGNGNSIFFSCPDQPAREYAV